MYILNFHTGAVCMSKIVDAPSEEVLRIFCDENHLVCKLAGAIADKPPVLILSEDSEVVFGSDRDIFPAYYKWWMRQVERIANPPQNVYEGVIEKKMDWQVFVNDEPFLPEESLQIIKHSPDGFSWGYYGSGCAQLALAILQNETCNPELALRRYHSFMEKVIAPLPSDKGWKINSKQVQDFLELAQEIDSISADLPHAHLCEKICKLVPIWKNTFNSEWKPGCVVDVWRAAEIAGYPFFCQNEKIYGTKDGKDTGLTIKILEQ